jgi:hypothetical protein
MKTQGQMLPEQATAQCVDSTPSTSSATIHRETVDSSGISTRVVLTRNHELIKRWAADRQAEPATGEATRSGPATVSVNDGGAGIRFNFPGYGAFRPIDWDEWLANFDQHECAFVFDEDQSKPLSNRYRIVKAREWGDFLCE